MIVEVGVGATEVEETGGGTIGPSNSFQQYLSINLTQSFVRSNPFFALVRSITAHPIAVDHSGSAEEDPGRNPV